MACPIHVYVLVTLKMEYIIKCNYKVQIPNQVTAVLKVRPLKQLRRSEIFSFTS